ncbi:unnamed protein product [Ilex paraguariensis]|uniref:D-glycerate 3-kinase, chloroplastic n=1 Tax=Ilex paraguariensis TaxID=185542 RepID=A0ABC8TYV7_9AQUA
MFRNTILAGLGCSWMQDNSLCHDTVPNQGRRPGPLRSVFPTAPAEVSSLKDLFEFICSGPLVKKLGLTSEMIAESIDKWIKCGVHLCRLFQLNELYLTIPEKARFYHYYIPVFLWCEQKISHHMSKFKDEEDVPPLVIGFSAPQGSGKTTLVFALDFLFRVSGRKSATLSIDDFYLTAEDQAKLRESNPGNALLELRGNAGSHDLALSVETLTALGKLTKEGLKMKLPRYDKSAYGGRGDRADHSTWPEVEGPLTVVLFEGWMLGFKPLPVDVVNAIDPLLETVNKNLEAYYEAWDKFINAWIVIKIKDPNCVYKWRLQAEIAMRADGKPGMSDDEVMDFVSRYLPAYKAYLPTLYVEGPNGSAPEHALVIEIDEGRNPVHDTILAGLGCSWMQDNSLCHDTVPNQGRRPGPLRSVFPTAPAEVSSLKDLFEFICSGPLVKKLGLTSEMIAESIDKWIKCGVHLCRLFQLNELYLTIPEKARFYHYYIPVFLWCEQKISHHMSKFKDEEDVPPLVIGFSAPQGSGKTTLVFALDFLFRVSGRKSATLSIDDFYLTAEDQAKLRESNPGNALLELRGNAGSHDLALSVETLTALGKLTKEGLKMKLPRYDKSAYGGRGDRADHSTWPEVEGPLTVVLFEGWMLGFKPLPVDVVNAIDPLLETVNKNLEAYYEAWDKFINAWIVIKIKDPNCVYKWRLQAEIAMRADGKPGMSDDEVMDFVSRYLPAYKAYLPTLYVEGPNGSAPEHALVIEIDEGRNPVHGD